MTQSQSQQFHRAIICQNRFSSFVRKRGQTNTQIYKYTDLPFISIDVFHYFILLSVECSFQNNSMSVAGGVAKKSKK